MIEDDDIIGQEDVDGDEILNPKTGAVTEETAGVPDKWKKLEADLKRIREREAEQDEISKLRRAMEASEGDVKDSTLSKKEQK